MNLIRTIVASLVIGMASSAAFAARPLPVVTKDGKQYYEYVVRRGETIYSITHQFNIDKELFLQTNPSVASDGLKADAIVFLPVDAVPAKKVVPLPTETVTQPGQTHLVQKGETLYGISKRYNTTVDKLIEKNPWASDGIKKGQVLALPLSEDSPEPTGIAPDYDNENADPSDSFDDPESDTEDSPAADLSREYSIAVLLPLMLNPQEDADRHAVKAAATYTSFLKGLIMAADTLGRTGDKVTVHAIDTEASDARVMSLLNDPRVREADVVLAPDASSQIAILAEAPDAGYVVFNILNVRDSAYVSNPAIMQGNIDHASMYAKAIEALRRNFSGYTPVILIPDGGKTEKIEFVNTLRSDFAAVPGSPEIREIHFSGNLSEEDLASLTPDSEKYVFIPVSGALSEFNRIQNALVQLKEKALDPESVKVFGYPDWIAFRIDRLEKLHKLDATIYSRFFDNPDAPEITRFANAYKACFGTEIVDMVPKQEILGYDTGCYLIKALRATEGNITDEPLEYKGIQSAFSFTQPAEGSGAVNNALYIINYRPSGEVTKEVF